MSLPDAEVVTRTRWGAVTQHRLVRFVLVGSINTVVDVAIYSLLAWAGLVLVVANLISTTCGLIVSYVLNRNYVFESDGGQHLLARLRQIALFFVTTGFGLWVLQPLVILGVTRLLAPASLPHLVVILVPKLLATVVTLIWNYSLYSLLVFARRSRVRTD